MSDPGAPIVEPENIYLLDLSIIWPNGWRMIAMPFNMFFVAVLVLVYYWLCDFIYLGRDSADVFGVQKGIICRMEFENVARHYMEHLDSFKDKVLNDPAPAVAVPPPKPGGAANPAPNTTADATTPLSAYQSYIQRLESIEQAHSHPPLSPADTELVGAIRRLRQKLDAAFDGKEKIAPDDKVQNVDIWDAPKQYPRKETPDPRKETPAPSMPRYFDLVRKNEDKAGTDKYLLSVTEREGYDNNVRDLIYVITNAKSHLAIVATRDSETKRFELLPLKDEEDTIAFENALREENANETLPPDKKTDNYRVIKPEQVSGNKATNESIDTNWIFFPPDPKMLGPEKEGLNLSRLFKANQFRHDYIFACNRGNSSIGVFKAGANVRANKPLLTIPAWYVDIISVTRVVRAAGEVIFLAFLACVLYHATGTGMVFPYVSKFLPSVWRKPIRTVLCVAILYLAWFLIFFGLFRLVGWLLGMPSAFCFRAFWRFIFYMVLFESARLISNLGWARGGICPGKQPIPQVPWRTAPGACEKARAFFRNLGHRIGAYFDADRWRCRAKKGPWNSFSILFDGHSHLFPLLGILGTFLGLGVAIPDRGLLDIIRHLSGGDASVSGEQWSELISGIGVAVFASLHGTFSTIFAQISAGYFGRDVEEPECNCPRCEAPSDSGGLAAQAQNGDPTQGGAASGSGEVVTPAGGGGRTDGHLNGGPAAPGIPPAQVGEILVKLDQNSATLAAIDSEIKKQSAAMGRLGLLTGYLSRLLYWIRRGLPEARKDLSQLKAREPEFTAIKDELARILERLYREPFVAMESIASTAKTKNDEARALIDQVRKDLGEPAQTIADRATAVSSSLERLNKLLEELNQGQWIRANDALMGRMNDLARDFEAFSKNAKLEPTQPDLGEAVEKALKPLEKLIKQALRNRTTKKKGPKL